MRSACPRKTRRKVSMQEYKYKQSMMAWFRTAHRITQGRAICCAGNDGNVCSKGCNFFSDGTENLSADLLVLGTLGHSLMHGSCAHSAWAARIIRDSTVKWGDQCGGLRLRCRQRPNEPLAAVLGCAPIHRGESCGREERLRVEDDRLEGYVVIICSGAHDARGDIGISCGANVSESPKTAEHCAVRVSRVRNKDPYDQSDAIPSVNQSVVSSLTFDLEQGRACGAMPQYAAVSRVDVVNREKGGSGVRCDVVGEMFLAALRDRYEKGIVNADCDLHGSSASA